VKPLLVVHLAAKVGGLFANMNDKVGFFEQNLMINMNVIQSSYQVGVRRLVCLLSTCIYPDNNEIPIKETDLHNGAPHHSNSGYAFAKRMCELQC
jgi:GDP-L-fucose synthase